MRERDAWCVLLQCERKRGRDGTCYEQRTREGRAWQCQRFIPATTSGPDTLLHGEDASGP